MNKKTSIGTNERPKRPKDERDNDQTAFQEQVEELSQLIQKITKGKQKATNLKDMIIDWLGVEISESSGKSQYIARSPKKNRYIQAYGIAGSSKEYGVAGSSKIDILNEIARIMDRLPEDKALNTRKTFDSQRKKRVYDTEYAPNENSAPVNAPKWAKVSYKKSLKHLVEKYSANREEVEDDKIQEVDDKSQEDDDKSQEDDDKIQEDDDKIQEDDDKIQEDDDKSQEDDDKSQEDNNKIQEDDNKSQEDDDTTGGEKNEDQEKEQDEEVDDRKKRKKRSVSLVSEEYDSSE
ncbi:hypothetical protein C1646_761577 [Rhizophagus diaphanus]|nr:hypothetical protein C1646_761577 [Rhizophagus diaphanus] [Rhizophagus sp. MUCL 43196]